MAKIKFTVRYQPPKHAPVSLAPPPPLPPTVCPGCGRYSPKHRAWCPVLVRLAAECLARVDPDGWWVLTRSRSLAYPPYSPAARFWRRVAREDPTPGYAGWLAHAPGGDVREVPIPVGANVPGWTSLYDRLGGILGHPVLTGSVPCDSPDDPFESQSVATHSVGGAIL